ncbi:MAG: LLM class flavin-dependent oxidoreductase [Acidimicrobiales bacterium]|nr:LLM class flavin-dependent oxidoreductase [Acidimicrobiales bacterium]
MSLLRPVPLSVLDLAVISSGSTARDALEASVALAQRADALGYRRVWYAEHHNMASIASSATSVLIAHIAAHTERIRLGSGGIMLPNHSPLTIAEQFGTLATLHPGRIDLGLGRAPGTDQITLRALRREPGAAESFPRDVLELQGYLRGDSRVPGVEAVPGAGTDVPLYILGSSLFGAQLAAALGLPYGFASHFAPGALVDAVAIYRREFQPSEQCTEPHVIAAVNAIVADTDEEAEAERVRATRSRVAAILGRRVAGGGRRLDDDELDALVASPQGRHVASMMTYTAAGSPTTAAEYLDWFIGHADADELIVAPASRELASRLRTLELLADVAGLEPPLR